jgi:hypothetical protein
MEAFFEPAMTAQGAEARIDFRATTTTTLERSPAKWKPVSVKKMLSINGLRLRVLTAKPVSFCGVQANL